MTLPEAQRLITAMLIECGLSRVIITHDGGHNRYSKRYSNVSYSFDDLATLADEMKPEPKMIQERLI